MKLLGLLFFLSSCSSVFQGTPQPGKKTYAYVDEGGTYKFTREFKLIKQKIVSRGQIIDTKGSGARVLEKSILVSQIGSIKTPKGRLLTVRPVASEFEVWLEGKRYSSKMNINPRSKSMRVTLESPESRWTGTSEIPFPKGKYFCFYNQLPECLYQTKLLETARENQDQNFDFYVIWDSYPYVQDQLSKVGKKLFAPASVKFDGAIKGQFRYIVEIEGQMVLYQFTKSYDLEKMAWVSQGITVAPPGQEIVEDE